MTISWPVTVQGTSAELRYLVCCLVNVELLKVTVRPTAGCRPNYGSAVFWDMMACGLVRISTFRRNLLPASCVRKTKLARSPDMSVHFPQTTRRLIPEATNSYKYCRENRV